MDGHSDSGHGTHVGHSGRRRHDRQEIGPSADDLNKASAEHHGFTSTDEQRAWVATVDQPDPSIGTFSYNFTVGGTGDKYIYAGDVTQNGVVHGKAHLENGVDATLPPHRAKLLDQFAAHDVKQAHEKTGQYAHVQSGLSYDQKYRMNEADARSIIEFSVRSNFEKMSASRFEQALEYAPDRMLTLMNEFPDIAKDVLKNSEKMKVARSYVAKSDADKNLAGKLKGIISEINRETLWTPPKIPGANPGLY